MACPLKVSKIERERFIQNATCLIFRNLFASLIVENTRVGPFLIVKRLGTNRRQKVYHARQTEQNRDVALKFIKTPPEIDYVVALSKIQRETEVLKQLNHPNLIRVYGAGADGDRIFFASELVEGESLAAILARRGKLAPDLAVEYGMQIASLLQYIHEQEIIHSKLTPDKIIITTDHQVKVSDLRLNRSRRRRWDQPRKHQLETAAYMAPEHFTEGATGKSDFYSLGVILFEMLTGKLPYAPDTIGRMTRRKIDQPVPSVATHVMNCPIWLDKIVTQMLQPKPRQRPHTAQAIVFAFNEIKKMDHDRKAVVSQVTSGFNPLTVGTDRAEANRLLGKKEKRRDDTPDVPFYQRVPFMLAALVGIAALIVWAVMPVSSEKLMERAKQFVDSGELSDARSELKQIMDRGPDDELSAEAESMYYELRKITLVELAEKGTFLAFPKTEKARAFCDAVVLEQEGSIDEARTILQEIIVSVPADGDMRYVYEAARERLEQMDLVREDNDFSETLGESGHDTTTGDPTTENNGSN